MFTSGRNLFERLGKKLGAIEVAAEVMSLGGWCKEEGRVIASILADPKQLESMKPGTVLPSPVSIVKRLRSERDEVVSRVLAACFGFDAMVTIMGGNVSGEVSAVTSLRTLLEEAVAEVDEETRRRVERNDELLASTVSAIAREIVVRGMWRREWFDPEVAALAIVAPISVFISGADVIGVDAKKLVEMPQIPVALTGYALALAVGKRVAATVLDLLAEIGKRVLEASGVDVSNLLRNISPEMHT